MDYSLTPFKDDLFSSDNDLEIPVLDINKQADSCEIPFLCYGEQKRSYDMKGNGTLHFYTDDYRFNSVFENPLNVLKHHPRQIVEPNYSLYADTPIAYGLQQIYKKRWVARALQERGVRVFVDLNVNSKFYKLNFIGVPLGWSSFCTRGYSDRLHYLEFEYEMANAYSGGNKLTFVIYGGGEKCRRFAQERGCVYITPVVVIRNKKEALKKIKGSIAFVEDEFNPERLVEKVQSELESQRVLDFRKQISDNH